MKDEALLIGDRQSLVGVYTEAVAEHGTRDEGAAVVMLNAGLVHHAGPQRLHVKLARALAAKGVSTLRADFSGIGDSPVREDDLSADEAVVQEQREMIDELARRGHRRVILFGICSGAKNALKAAAGDERIKALILVNQAVNEVDPGTALNMSMQYYLKRSLWNPRAWWNLVTGRVNYRNLATSIAGALRGKASGSGRTEDADAVLSLFQREMRPALDRRLRSLIVLSDRDARHANLIVNNLEAVADGDLIRIVTYPEADHVFTDLSDQEALINQVCEWVEGFGLDAGERTTISL